MRWLICTLYLSISALTFAQGFDTSRVYNLLDSSKQYRNIDPEKAKDFLDKAMILNKEFYYVRGWGSAEMNYAVLDYFQGDLASALDHNNIADSIFTSIQDSASLARLYSNRGIVYILLENYERALDDLLLAQDINESRGDTARMMNVYGTIGGIYFKEEIYDKAWEAYDKVLKYNELQGDSQGVSIYVGNMGGILVYQEKYDEAEKYFRREKAIFDHQNNPRGQLNSLNHFGLLYEKQGRWDEARVYYKQGHELAKNLNATIIASTAAGNVCTTYFLEKDYPNAIDWKLIELDMVLELKDSVMLRKIYRDLAECYALNGQSTEALDAMFKYDRINTVLSERESEKLIENMQFKHDLYDKEKELRISRQKAALQELELANKNLILLFGGLAVLVLVVVVYVFMRLRQQRMQMRNAQLQNNLLRSKINPHFIFNVFNSIQAYFLKKDYQKGEEHLRKFAKLMREFLERSDETSTSIREESTIMELYLQVENLRLEEKLEISIEIDDQLDLDNMLVPAFIAQVYLENAVWHGAGELDEGGKIRIHWRLKGDQILLTIEDNGIGIEASKKSKKGKGGHVSRGMEINRERLSLLNKQRKHQYAIDIVDLSATGEGQGTRVIIQMPVVYL